MTYMGGFSTQGIPKPPWQTQAAQTQTLSQPKWTEFEDWLKRNKSGWWMPQGFSQNYQSGGGKDDLFDALGYARRNLGVTNAWNMPDAYTGEFLNQRMQQQQPEPVKDLPGGPYQGIPAPGQVQQAPSTIRPGGPVLSEEEMRKRRTDDFIKEMNQRFQGVWANVPKQQYEDIWQTGKRKLEESSAERQQKLENQLNRLGIASGGTMLEATGRLNRDLGNQLQELRTNIAGQQGSAMQKTLDDTVNYLNQRLFREEGYNRDDVQTALTNARQDALIKANQAREDYLNNLEYQRKLQLLGTQQGYSADLYSLQLNAQQAAERARNQWNLWGTVGQSLGAYGQSQGWFGAQQPGYGETEYGAYTPGYAGGATAPGAGATGATSFGGDYLTEPVGFQWG